MSTSHNLQSPDAQSAVGRRIYLAGAIFAFLFSLVLYSMTVEATSSFWDSGEFIASAYRLGIPHSPGTPLYVLVAKVFTLLPIWFLTIAQRVNFLSAFCGAAGVLFIYVLIVRFLEYTMGRSRSVSDAVIRVSGALVGALFLAFSDTYWNNSVEAEVYSMSNATMGFMTWLTLKWSENPKSPRSVPLIYLIFYLLALSIGFHMGTILVFSGIFFFVLMTKDRSFSTFEFLVACLGVGIFMADATLYRNGQITVFLLIAFTVLLLWTYSARSPFATVCSALFVLGISVHLYLKIRSGLNPSIDEGNPETWRSLYAVLRREQYPPTDITRRKATWLFQFKHFNGYFQAQFQMASAYVAQLNLGSLFPIGLGIWGMVDQFTRHKKTFVMLFVTFLVMSVGLIAFLNFSDSEVRERDYFYSPAFYYFAIYIGMGAASLLAELRNIFSGRNPSTSLTAPVAASCVLFIAMPFFTLKHHYFSHDRSRNIICSEYAENMLVGLEKDGIIFTNGDNDTFPLWYIQDVEGFRTDVRVVNLSLLNTPWYIKQLRDNEPGVPIDWTDAEIDHLQPAPSKDGWLLIRDIAVNHILKTNRFRRPVYFAVTIPSETWAPYREYLEMEGLVQKVVARKGDNMINVTKLQRNVMENYHYNGILTADWERDNTLFRPIHVEHLIQNYAVAFYQLAVIAHQDSNYTDALKYVKIAGEISPQMSAPRQLIGLYYLDAGDTTGALAYYMRKIDEDPGDLMMIYRLAGVYERMGDYQRALDHLDGLVTAEPTDRELMMAAFTMAMRAGVVQKARRYLADWLTLRPNDDAVRQTLQDVDRQLREGQ